MEDEVVRDAVTALGMMRKTAGVDPDRLILLGHSMGAMLASRIVKRGVRAAGLVLLAGPTRPLPEVIGTQMEFLAGVEGAGVSRDEVDEILASITQIERLTVADLEDPTKVLGAPASYWLDLRGYDPAAAIRQLDLPVLALWGDRDFQVSEVDQEGWRRALAGRFDATFTTYGGLNHLFEAGSGASTFAEYGEPGHVSSVVVADIASWIVSRFPLGRGR